MARIVWFFNPLAMRLAGLIPWWVVLETTGRRSGQPRRVPLARGPRDGDVTWLISVHGRRAGFARNVEANPRVRLKLNGRWRTATAQVVDMDPDVLRRFNPYARLGPATLGIEPALVRVELED